MINKNRITLGITMGDPSGIGPEIILKSFERKRLRKNRIMVIGDYKVMQKAYNILNINSYKLNRIIDTDEYSDEKDILNILDLHLINLKKLIPGRIQISSGNAAFEYIRKAVELANKGMIKAIVTAPLNKESLHKAEHNYAGHTEILASLTGTMDYAMLLHHKKLNIIHVSTHIPLIQAITGLRRERIEKVIDLGNSIMKRLVARDPVIAVAGINPHAGENGLFGDEEIKEIVPAVRNMKNRGINVEGPFPPDTIYLQAFKGKYDLVVAMYHDQGHIPLKLIGFESGVNVTAGLPFIRTSVDHGTAFDIAWKGIADESSMVNAIRLALKLI